VKARILLTQQYEPSGFVGHRRMSNFRHSYFDSLSRLEQSFSGEEAVKTEEHMVSTFPIWGQKCFEFSVVLAKKHLVSD